MKPLAIELFCGRFGWGRGFVSEGYRVIGFDIFHESYHKPIPEGCELVMQDVLTLHGSQFRDAAAIVASPPCQAYSYRAMPWKRAKALPPPSNELFDACFRIQREASEAAGRYIPMVVENVRGAQPWVGRARWHYGSYYLWGDVPALMPFSGKLLKGRSNFHFFEQTGLPSPSFHGAEHEASVQRHQVIKGNGRTWFGESHGEKFEGQPGNPARGDAVKVPSASGRRTDVGNGVRFTSRDCGVEGVKQSGLSGEAWFNEGAAAMSSRSDSRKAASAAIAEIPYDLAQWVARCLKP